MAKDPNARPHSAESVAHELQAIQRAGGWDITPILVFGPPITAEPGTAAAARPRTPVGLDDTTLTGGGEAPAEPRGSSTERVEASLAAAILQCGSGHVIERSHRPQRFCRYCGEPLLARCSNGHAVEAEDRFCGDCGVPVS